MNILYEWGREREREGGGGGGGLGYPESPRMMTLRRTFLRDIVVVFWVE